MKKTYLLLAFLLLTISGILNVNAQTGTWTLVTNANDLAVGDQIIIAAAGYNYAISTTQNTNNRAATAITKNDDNTLETPSGSVQIITLEQGTVTTTMTYAFNVGNGYLHAASSSSNYLRTQQAKDANSSWTISIASDGAATIQAQGNNTRNLLRYNSTGNNPLFSCYRSGQNAVVIYKLVASEPHTVTFDAGTGTCDVTELTEQEGDGGIVLPEATACHTAEGYEFIGWYHESLATESTSQYNILPAGMTYYPSDDETLYAVYSITTQTVISTPSFVDVTSMDIGIGDQVIIVYKNTDANENYELTGIVHPTTGNDYGECTLFESYPTGAYPLTLVSGNAYGSFAFKDNDNKYLYWGAGGNNLSNNASMSNNTCWHISFTSNSSVAIENVLEEGRSIRWNNGSNPKRFSTYGANSNLPLVRLMRLEMNETEVELYKYYTSPECGYAINYELMQGSFVEGYNPPTSYSTGTSVTLPTADNVELYGQTFAGWYTDWEYTDGPYTTIDDTAKSNKFFYAKWEPIDMYTVTFDAGNGTCETAELTEQEPGGGVELPEATPCAQINGYSFAGWSDMPIDEPTTNITHLYTAGSIYNPTDNLTLYAVYSKTEDEVTTYTTNLICLYQLFVSVTPENAGTVNIDPFDYGDGYYPSNVTITLTAIPEDGYQFSFWSINDELASTTNPLQLTLNEDTHVEANFIAVGECSAVSDAEGNAYTSVNIAGSCWTTTNLVLPADNAMVYKSDMHNDEEANLDTYGYLYDWNTAIGAGATPDDNGNVQGICPTGWHIPTVTEVYAAAGLNTSTEIDDLRANGLWLDGGGNNSTGLSLLPGGYYNVDADRFDNMLSHSYFWCIDPAQPSQPKVFWADCHCYMFQVNDTTPGMGYSVRCVKD